MTVEYVWDAFFLYSILQDHEERGTFLELEHDVTRQSDRLRPALDARNRLMAGPGQEQWSHACDLCCSLSENDEGRVCTLQPSGVRYCWSHAAKETKCVILSCDSPAESGFQTCGTTAHRALEDFKRLENCAMFRLKQRLDRLRTSHAATSRSSGPATLEGFELDAFLASESMELTADDDNDDELIDIECEEKSPHS
ncbi:uncharacterized protein C8Q71DRAFT_718407 [Rhodofomes roseus]|uniref:CxC6 like cysteine cluster associated with KDZ domain-containing protein n=1 Tax=Rhodofomes roseus TaxID=34475 RepID=A0ABQ8JYR0_9APHY|nr:uncharacterized protein C8Q71DRAFT_718407 [Rhodofomes roseus]KAH9829320.1 hypothetical protein C8Q71DRAFT_718407 [Rhodofomes roseus]